MKARRTTVRAATMRVAAIVIAAGTPAAADAQSWNVQGVTSMSTTWGAWVTGAQVLQTVLSTGGAAAQLTVQTSYLPTPLLDFIAATLGGKAPSTKLLLTTVSSTGTLSSLMSIGGTHLQEIDLPAADAGNIGPAPVGLTFAAASAAVGKPSVFPPGNLPGQDLHARYFHLQFDSLDATTAMVVKSMKIVLPDALQGKLPQLVLTYSVSTTSGPSQTFANGLQKWFASQTTRNGTLTFFTSDFKTPLMVERFRGLRVLSINTINPAAPIATFALTGISVQSAVAY